jgi:glycosyltransferase involved in cell wall biosynthesis
MISIITSIHNQLAMNRLFYQSIREFTHFPFELIIIDNASTDGSSEFFESVGATVIKTNANYSYPYCQNRGLKAAKNEWLAFLDNDIIVSPAWDRHIIESMVLNELEIATACGLEGLENSTATKKLRNKWEKLRSLLSLTGNFEYALKLTHTLMYKDWVEFCRRRYEDFQHEIKIGFVGNAVMINKMALQKIGLWDERIQAGDYDLFLRTMERHQQKGDIKPVHVCLDTYVHHFIKLPRKDNPPVFTDENNLISLHEKWGAKTKKYLSVFEE